MYEKPGGWLFGQVMDMGVPLRPKKFKLSHCFFATKNKM